MKIWTTASRNHFNRTLLGGNVKKTVILAIVLFHLCAGYALGGQFGPAEPQAKFGISHIGIGYHHYVDKWKFGNSHSNVSQDQIFLQMHVGLFPGGEVYLKLGQSNLEIDNGLSDLNSFNDFKGNYKLYETVGLRGLFVRGPYLDIGGFAEVSIFSKYEDATLAGTRLSIDNIISSNIGMVFQKRVDGGFLYAGPFFHYLEGKYHTSSDNLISSGTLKPNNYLGLFAGFRVIPTRHVVFTGEIQVREAVSAGAAISFRL
jgi:hypothetical protein